MNTPLLLTLIAAFFAWMLYIGYRTHTGKTGAELRENFLIGNRNIPAWLVAIGTTMGWVDGFQFGFLPAMSFDSGWAILWYIAGIPIAFIALTLFASKMREHAAKHGAYMMGNYFSKQFSPRCAATVGVIMLVYFFIWLAGQFVVGGQVLSTLTGVPYTAVIFAMGSVTLIYMLLGGFLASIRTDLMQFAIFILFVLAMLALWVPSIPQWHTAPAPITTGGWLTNLSLLVMNIAATLAAPDVWQRIYSAKTARDARRSMAITSIVMTGMLLVFVFFGFALKGMGLIPTSETAAQAVFTHLIPGWLMPLAVITFLAAIMSTIATTLFGSTMTAVSDIAVELKWLPREQMTTAVRYGMVISLLLALTLASLNTDIVSLAFLVLSVTEVALPLAIAALAGWKITERAAFYSLVFGLAAFAYGAWHNLFHGPLGLMPFVITTGTLLLLQGLTAPKTPPKKR